MEHQQDQEIINKPAEKKKYNYGDKYKGKYKTTLHQIYLRNKAKETEEERQAKKEYKHQHYLNNKEKYLENSKIQNKRVSEALKLLRNVENGIIKTVVNKDILKLNI